MHNIYTVVLLYTAYLETLSIDRKIGNCDVGGLTAYSCSVEEWW